MDIKRGFTDDHNIFYDQSRIKCSRSYGQLLSFSCLQRVWNLTIAPRWLGLGSDLGVRACEKTVDAMMVIMVVVNKSCMELVECTRPRKF